MGKMGKLLPLPGLSMSDFDDAAGDVDNDGGADRHSKSRVGKASVVKSSLSNHVLKPSSTSRRSSNLRRKLTAALTSSNVTPSGIPRLPARTASMPMPADASLVRLLSTDAMDMDGSNPAYSLPTVTGEEPVTLYDVPAFVRFAVDNIRSRAIAVAKPTLNKVLCSAIHLGLLQVEANSDLHGLLEVKHNLDTMNLQVEDGLIDACQEWLLSFPLTFPDYNLGKRLRFNLSMSTQLKQKLSSYGVDLGLTVSSMSLTACLYGLRGQEGLRDEYLATIDRLLAGFETKARIRNGLSSKLLEFVLEMAKKEEA